jgi:hypothetical protein
VRRSWFSLPPIMERKFRDDVKAALLVLAGATAGYFVFGANDPTVLLEVVVGCAVLIVVLSILRRVLRGKVHRAD